MSEKNIKLIWDTQTENTPEQGWYTRHSEHGITDYLDDPIGNKNTTKQEALKLACDRFSTTPASISIIGDGPTLYVAAHIDCEN